MSDKLVPVAEELVAETDAETFAPVRSIESSTAEPVAALPIFRDIPNLFEKVLQQTKPKPVEEVKLRSSILDEDMLLETCNDPALMAVFQIQNVNSPTLTWAVSIIGTSGTSVL